MGFAGSARLCQNPGSSSCNWAAVMWSSATWAGLVYQLASCWKIIFHFRLCASPAFIIPGSWSSAHTWRVLVSITRMSLICAMFQARARRSPQTAAVTAMGPAAGRRPHAHAEAGAGVYYAGRVAYDLAGDEVGPRLVQGDDAVEGVEGLPECPVGGAYQRQTGFPKLDTGQGNLT
ncbi:hypothetical protein F4778DRAFT_754093 [Xylariomycetidae sp. FL2044]|nr:hypothetical protein F4778DRAFT_754093 [Xylariomycetidae sp. FL2044]